MSRLLIYSHAFSPSVGGVETFVQLLARGLADPGPDSWEVTVVTQTPSDVQEPVTAFRVVRSPSVAVLTRLIAASDVVLLAGPCLVPLALAKLCRRPVVVEHHGYQAMCANGLLLQRDPTGRGSPCPGHFRRGSHGECYRCERASLGRSASVARLLATGLRRALCASGVSNVAITRHVEARLELPNTVTIYYGIPVPGETPPPSRPQARPVCFAYVGRLVEEKGLPLLVQAFADMPANERSACVLRFVGDGPAAGELKRLARELGVASSVEFRGFLVGSALAEALEEVDAVVMPSIWEETAGLSAIEHMMRGRVVIAAAIGGLGEVVGDAGLRFPAGDVPALTAHMARVARDPAAAQELGARARSRAIELFGVTTMVQRYGEFLRSRINDSGEDQARPWGNRRSAARRS